jgi:hypothetical protein
MTRKISAIFVISLLLVAFLSLTAFGANVAKEKKELIKQKNRLPVDQPAAKVEGSDQFKNYVPIHKDGETQSLGFDQSSASLSPGYTVGTTTYDYQTNGSVLRRVEWRGTDKLVKFAWMKKEDFGEPYFERRTTYQAYNPNTGSFTQTSGGSDIHSLTQVSGYVTLDVQPTGHAVIGNHHTPTGDGDVQAATVWYEYAATGGYFGPYRTPLPDTTMQYWEDPDQDYRYLWPSVDYQVNGTDTVTHIFAQQSKEGAGTPQKIMYFRRVGSAAEGTFDYPPVKVDEVQDIAQVVTASRVSRKVALVWDAGYTSPPGDTITPDRGQLLNDIFYKINTDMGAPGSWQPTVNVTKFDSSKIDWVAHTDLSALIGTDDYLHIVWNARQVDLASGTFPRGVGSRIFHYSDRFPGIISTVKDANWEIPEDGCYGGAWNVMSLVKMSISECDGKFYTLFTQYNDIYNGIDDDCHNANWSANYSSGTANGELYISVSGNGGRNWDIARNLTNSYTPHCDSAPSLGGTLECDSDMWATMSRFGMNSAGLNFTAIPKIDPSGGGYAGDYYLDVFYVNDKYPGGCVQDQGIWTTNPMKWFRVACVEPVLNPVIAFTPAAIEDPAWTKPGIQKDTVVRIENIGNKALTISNIANFELTGSNWLGTDITSATISDGSDNNPNFKDMHVYLNQGGVVGTGPVGYDGIIVFTSDAPSSPDTFAIHIIIADTVQFPQWADIRTASKRMIFNNAGNIGKGGEDGYTLDYFDDCDTANNVTGANDNAEIYLYDASPFLLRVSGSDTILNSYIWDANWLDNDGFRPLKGITIDSSGTNGYNYAYTGKYLSKDSAIAIETEYYLPTHPDTSDFIVQKIKVYSNMTATIPGVMIGELMDWDIPSDSGVDNGSTFDAGRKLMYCYGGEYGADTGSLAPWNDCILANDRAGGIAYVGGFLVKKGMANADTDSLAMKGMFTGSNSNWQASTGNFPPGALYQKLWEGGALFSGYEPWEGQTADPESIYVDLNMVAFYGQFDLGYVPPPSASAGTDTLVFIKILATTNDQQAKGRTMGQIIDQARAWIRGRRGMGNCCNKAGDANNNGTVQATDVTYIVNYMYKDGSRPPCIGEADATGNGVVQATDVTRVVNFMYKSGPAPICPPGAAYK